MRGHKYPGCEALGLNCEHNSNRMKSKEFQEGYAQAITDAAKRVEEAIHYHYDEYKNDCGVCGAMLSKCSKDCIIPDLLEAVKDIKNLSRGSR